MPKKKKPKIDGQAIKRFIEERLILEPHRLLGIGVWGLGTVVVHQLNIHGWISGPTWISTGLPFPFHQRPRFPWEKQSEPTIEDKIIEWGIPAIISYVMVYHPEAIAEVIGNITEAVSAAAGSEG